jgi:hypothetical protein
MNCHADLLIGTDLFEEHSTSIFRTKQSKKRRDCLTLQMEALLSSENIVNYLPVDTVWHPRKLEYRRFLVLVFYRQVVLYTISFCAISL